MPCLLALLALITPRLVIVLLLLFTGWLQGVFDTLLWPILGFVFLPTSLLWYSAVHHWFAGQWTLLAVLGMIAAVLVDLSPATGRRERMPAA